MLPLRFKRAFLYTSLVETELLDAFAGEGPGAVFGKQLADLNATLVAWPLGHIIPPHVNEEVDVVMVVFAGKGGAVVNKVEFDLQPGSILVIPKGVERSIISRSNDFRYLNVHARRKGLMPRLLR